MKIAVIPGDGIGPEVITQALRILHHCISQVDTQEFDFGVQHYITTGSVLTDEDLLQLQSYDAILLGALGDPRIPSGILERGFLLKLRFAFDYHINLRPFRTYPGVPTPTGHDCDLVVIREGTEGLYVGNGGVIRKNTAHEIATEVSINTRYSVQQVVEEGFRRAQLRRKKLTLVHKTNVLAFAGSLWERTVNDIAVLYPDVTVDYLHVDAATLFLVNNPGHFDVIVTDNLFGDILADLAAAITGGIGLAASANINVNRTYPAMFEPVHGSAPDIAGQGIADPVAAILSVALLFDHLDHPAAANAVRDAVAMELLERRGEYLPTTAVGDRILANL